MSIFNNFVHNVSSVAKAAALGVMTALAVSSCGGGEEPTPQPGPGGKTGSFKEVGIAARLDMAGDEGRKMDPSLGYPDIPPTMTKLYAFYYEGSKELAYGGNVVTTGTEKFGFKRIDPSQPVTFTKIVGSPEDRRYTVNNATHAYFANGSDTTAFKITDKTQLISFPKQETTEFVYKNATRVNGPNISLEKAQL